MNESEEKNQDTIQSLTSFCKENDRVCPMPLLWNDFWALLADDHTIGVGDEDYWPPLILAAWVESDDNKSNRLSKQIELADKLGLLQKASQFLRDLHESEWYHITI